MNAAWRPGHGAASAIPRADHEMIAIPLAGGALHWPGVTLPPAVGAILMSASTIVVALNAQLLRRLDLRSDR